MPFKPVFLVTDVLIFVLLLLVGVFIWYASRHEHMRAPWRRVVRRPMAMAAACVIVVYLLIAVVDSIHFRERLPDNNYYSPEVVSLLDVLLSPLRLRSERTYSAPFAIHAFAKETTVLADGREIRDYPRLIHGGKHVQDPSEHLADVSGRTLNAFAMGAVIWLLLHVAFVFWRGRRRGLRLAAAMGRLWRGESEYPWRTVWLTLGAIILLVCFLTYLSGSYYVFGTDKVGQDVLLKSIKSIRTGLMIGTLTTLVMLPFALILGVMAGYLRGWVDDVIQYLYTTLSSIPSVLLIAAAILSLQVYIANHPEFFETLSERSDARLLFLCVILGITSWTSLCRLLRGETMKLREIDYVLAAQALGVRTTRIMGRHLIPNIMHIVLIAVVLDFSGLVLAEAVLSYVGVGVDPTMDSWGNMINSARLEMARDPMVWWSLMAAFVFMFSLVLAANLFSDAVRDAFDPRLRKA